MFGLVTSKAYQGTTTANPFRFQHFNMNSVSLVVNSKNYPAIRYQPDFAGGKFAREYRGFTDAIGVGFLNQGCLVEPDRFKDGACLFAFDLTPGEFFYEYNSMSLSYQQFNSFF